MEIYQAAWVQGGALLLLIGCGGMTIRVLWKELRAKDKRNEEFGDRVITGLGRATAAIEAHTDAQRGLIDRIDRMRP